MASQSATSPDPVRSARAPRRVARLALPILLAVPARAAQEVSPPVPDSLAELLAIEDVLERVAEQAIETTVEVRLRDQRGSGVLVSADGLVLTAAHVVGRPGERARLTLADGRRVRATTLGVNLRMDSGMLRITTPGEYPFAELAPPRELRTGEWVLATGHPGGLQEGRPPVVRAGRLLEPMESWLRSECTISYGDSGGPLFDAGGRLIGVHSRVMRDLSQNYHVPVRSFRQSWVRLLAGEAWGGEGWQPPLLGVRMRDARGEGCSISAVGPGSPADEAGLRAGDRVLALESEPVARSRDVIDLLSDHRPGAELRLSVLRDGRPLELRVVLAAPDRESAP